MAATDEMAILNGWLSMVSSIMQGRHVTDDDRDDSRIDQVVVPNPFTGTNKKKPETSSVPASSSFSPFGQKRS